MERARGIRLRLGGTPSLLDQFPDKPKGMRWKRYQRLQDQYEYYDQASLRFIMERLHVLADAVSKPDAGSLPNQDG